VNDSGRSEMGRGFAIQGNTGSWLSRLEAIRLRNRQVLAEQIRRTRSDLTVSAASKIIRSTRGSSITDDVQPYDIGSFLFEIRMVAEHIAIHAMMPPLRLCQKEEVLAESMVAHLAFRKKA